MINCGDSYLFVNDSCSKAKARSQKKVVMKLNGTDETDIGQGTGKRPSMSPSEKEPWRAELWKMGGWTRPEEDGQRAGPRREPEQAHGVGQGVPTSDRPAGSRQGQPSSQPASGVSGSRREAPVAGLGTGMPGPDPQRKNRGQAGAQCLGPQKFKDGCA